MSPRFTRLAWLTAVCTYLLIVLGAIVRITGSGMGCGDHWPLCNGGLFPSLGNLGMLIEWSHRLVAALLSVLVVALAGYAWWLRRETALDRPGLAAYAALGLLALQVALGAVTVKLALPAWTVILHLGTAMLLLATLIVAARGPRLIPGSPRLRAGSVRAGLVALVLGFVTVLLGALTANLGAGTACLGFPLCNGHLLPDGTSLRLLQSIHRLLAYTLFGYVVWWAVRSKRGGAWAVAALVTLQVVVAAAMVLLALPRPLQAMHVAIGTGVWAALVLAVVGGRGR